MEVENKEREWEEGQEKVFKDWVWTRQETGLRPTSSSAALRIPGGGSPSEEFRTGPQANARLIVRDTRADKLRTSSRIVQALLSPPSAIQQARQALIRQARRPDEPTRELVRYSLLEDAHVRDLGHSSKASLAKRTSVICVHVRGTLLSQRRPPTLGRTLDKL